jgi:hypothetical protein
MWWNVALGRTDISEEHDASIIKVIPIGNANAVPSSLISFTLMVEATWSYERLFSQEPQGVTGQKTVIFIAIAVKKSNLTKQFPHLISRHITAKPLKLPPSINTISSASYQYRESLWKLAYNVLQNRVSADKYSTL